jgi:energy-coupling factor transport system permease protein
VIRTREQAGRDPRSQRWRSARRLSDFHVLRYVPGSSALHRMWAGTKILALTASSIGLVLWPSWKVAGVAAVLLLAGFGTAKLPRGIVPRIPRWIFLVVLVSFLLALGSGGSPTVKVGHVALGFGGVDRWALFASIGLEVLAFAGLVSWTTQLADLAPALGRLTRPLGILRLPVDEMIGATALAIRCLPLLLEEARIQSAARRSRRPATRRDFRSYSREAEEVMFAALSNALRRSREMAEAIEARGGVPTLARETRRLKSPDVVALALTACAFAAMAVLR